MNGLSLLPAIAECVLTLVVLWSNIGFGQTAPHSKEVPIPPEPGLTSPPPLEVDDSQIRDQKHEKFTELRDRIEQLRELLRNHHSSKPEDGTDDSSAPYGQGLSNGQRHDPSKLSNPGATTNSGQEASSNEASSQSSDSAGEKGLGVAPAVDGAIDRVSFASSLFASGEYETCVQTIQSIELSSQRAEVQ
ncbi:hypothetical protein [Thalassoglobus neptunius]|nr:hypothetical protein [Thalassoglobus neptunius]